MNPRPTRDRMKHQEEFDFTWDFAKELATRNEPEEDAWDDGDAIFGKSSTQDW